MKRYLLIAICLLVLYPAYGQLLIKENKIWSYSSIGTEDPCFFYDIPCNITNSHYKIGEEFIINDTVYHKILYSNTYDPYNWRWPENRSFIREKDSVVYRRVAIEENEYVVFDYSKKVGEEIIIGTHRSYHTIDTIVFRNIQGMEIKQWHFSRYDEDFGFHTDAGTFYERIGSFYDFMKPMMPIGADITLLCVWEDDELIYLDENHQTCHMVATNVTLYPEVKELLVLLSNEPKQLVVINKAEQSGMLAFYTLKGEMIKKISINELEIIVPLPVSGLLIFSFIANDGKVQTGKVLAK
jgi:hypothetical protein